MTRRAGAGLISRRALLVGRSAALCGVVGVLMLVATRGVGSLVGLGLVLVFCVASWSIGFQALRELRRRRAHR